MYYAQKDIINPNDIKANIYDYIELIIDIDGILDENITPFINNEFVSLFPPDIYKRTKTELYEQELNEYEKRNALELSDTSRKRFLETETVHRYYAKNDTERISISQMFISVKLDYKCAHSLNEKIDLIAKIMSYLMKNDYLIIDRITLNKKDSVICKTLFRLYQCFNKNLFGDIAYSLLRKSNVVEEIFLQNSTVFTCNNYYAEVSRTVRSGLYENNKAYQGNLIIDINCMNFKIDEDKEKNPGKIIKTFHDLNEICFDIFMEHITLSFAKDLINGNTNKVLGGFNKNE